MPIRDDFVLELTESIPVMLGYVDRELRYKHANRAYLEWNAVSLETLLKTTVLDFFGAEMYASIKPHVEAVLAGEQQQFYVENIMRGSQVRTLQANYVPDVRADKTVRGFFFSIIDISNHLVAGSDPKAMFERVFEFGPAGIVLVDSEFRFISVNTRFCQMLGYSEAEIIGKTFLDLTHPDDVNQSSNMTFSAFQSGQQFFRLEKRYLRKDGQTVYAYLMASVVKGERGEPPRAIAIIEDITDRKFNEERLRRAERLGAIGELSGGLAHDFNNLLSVVLGNLDLVAEKLEAYPDALFDCKRLLDSATGAAERGASLTQRLLAFSRKQALEPTILDLNKVIGQVDDLIRHALDESIETEIIRSAGLWLCEVDKSQVENVLMNLAINARDAMPEGGQLTIETGNVVLDDEYVLGRDELISGQYVMLAVTDTGCGMSEEVARQAVEPFYTTKDVGRGSGLGLSMVYGFVKQSGGHLSIYGEVGEGTTIKVYLPRTHLTPAEEDTYSEVSVPRKGAGEVILLVEDDESLRRLTASLLADMGYKVYQAENALAARKVFSQLPRLDLLLTDVVLPGHVGGRALSEILIAEQPGLKVLYMSGYTENSIVHNGRLDPGAILLQKPFRKEKLAIKVTQALMS